MHVKRNKMKWRSLTAAMMGAGMLLVNVGTVHAAGMDMYQLQHKFPNGAYWNHVVQEGHSSFSGYHDLGECNNPDGYTWHPCTDHFDGVYKEQQIGWTDCNRYGSSIQCQGFAYKLGQEVYGQNFYVWPKEEGKKEGIKPGDIIWYYEEFGHPYGHQAMVIDVDGEWVCLGECNAYMPCYISWGRWTNVSKYQYTIYSAPYELPKSGFNNLLKEKKGDINQDGERTMEDVSSALRCTLQMESLDETGRWCADMDGDGRISLEDTLFVLKVVLGAEEICDTLVEESYPSKIFVEWEKKFKKEFWGNIPEDEYWKLRKEAFQKIVIEGDLDFAIEP